VFDSGVSPHVLVKVLCGVGAVSFEVRVKVGLGEEDAGAVGAFEVLIVVSGVAHNLVYFGLYAISFSVKTPNFGA
jgi:hypothetical protein